MATHSSILAWRILGTEGPGGLLSMGLHRVEHDCSNLAAAAAAGKILEERVEQELVLQPSLENRIYLKNTINLTQ